MINEARDATFIYSGKAIIVVKSVYNEDLVLSQNLSNNLCVDTQGLFIFYFEVIVCIIDIFVFVDFNSTQI